MKKIISLFVVCIMIISIFGMISYASAATDGSGTITLSKDPINVKTKATVFVKEPSETSYSVSSKTIEQNSPNAVFDFKAELDMENVSDVFTKILELDSVKNKNFNSYKIYGDFVITIEYPKANFDASGIENSTPINSGFTKIGSIYQVSEPSIDKDSDLEKVKVSFDVNLGSGVLVSELEDNNEIGLSNIVFEAKNVKTSAFGTYTVKVGLTGKTIVKKIHDDGSETNVIGPNFNTTVNYNIVDAIGSVTVKQPSSGGGGGSVLTKRYTLTYETNGGEEIDKEEYVSGKIASLTKIPEKEGYIFGGWYLDEELTEAVEEVKMTKNITVYAKWLEDNGTAGSGYETPEMLNGDDHFAYVVGYPDGTVRPNDNITRAEVTAIFFRLLKEETRTNAFSTDNSFIDVKTEDWYNNPVSTMVKLGIVKGRTSETFVPNGFITRAEFAAICSRFEEAEYELNDKFTDVNEHWAEDEIHESAAHGWIKGYQDNTFKPDQFITRAEAMTMINRVLNRVPETADDLLDDMIKWPDNSEISAWYYLPVQEATNSHNFEMKNKIYEKWTSLENVTDWTTYEK